MSLSGDCIDLVDNSVLKPWVMRLGLRHQGVLLTSVRGCDTAPKHDASKLLARDYRGEILKCHCGNASKAATFIEEPSHEELIKRFLDYRKNLDHYPHHYVMHLVHAAEIVGYYHPSVPRRELWNQFYRDLCRGLHVNPETKEELDARLNADEETFGERDRS